MLKRSLGLGPPQPLWNALHIVQLASVPIWKMLRLGSDQVPISQDNPKGGRSEMDWDLGGWSMGMTWPACKHVPCYIAGMLALSCQNRKLFETF